MGKWERLLQDRRIFATSVSQRSRTRTAQKKTSSRQPTKPAGSSAGAMFLARSTIVPAWLRFLSVRAAVALQLTTSPYRVLPKRFQATPIFISCFVCVAFLLVVGYLVRTRRIVARLRERAEERANERIQIARELHDTFLQSVQGLILSFHVASQQVAREDEARKLLDGALARADRLLLEGRDLISQLRSETLEQIELGEALVVLGADLNLDNQLRYEVLTLGTLQEVDELVKTELFYIGREAVTNAFRHAQATHIIVRLQFDRRRFTLACTDNGRGFDTKTPIRRGHYGMLGMQERTKKIGGSFEVNSSSHGSRIIVEVPGGRAYVRRTFLRSMFQKNGNSL